MIKAIIVEDEKPAAGHLQKLIAGSNYSIEVIVVLESITQTVTWLSNNPSPDLIFLDIQLSDGISFEIFNQTAIQSPVIFTTAYEEYAIKAFKVNSIDYLLKPINQDDLNFALKKFLSLPKNEITTTDQAFKYKVDNVLKLLTHNYKTRFVVNAGTHIKSIETEKILFFYSLEKSTFLTDETGKSYDIGYSLEQVEKLIDPICFFRINRKYIINITAIEDIITYSASSLKVKVFRSSADDMIVSRSHLKEFREWLGR
jgi:DNA-binding LytR/AlgR family response regulator